MATTIEWLTGKMPKVLLSPQVKGDMDAVVAHGGSDEIGWLGFVRRLDFDFEVYRIVLPQQEVHAATTEITPAGIAEIVEELLTSGEITTDEVSNLRLWGHSHVNMGVSPSHQDNEQMRVFVNGVTPDGPNPFFIRVIANKKGEYSFAIFQYNIGIALIEAPWEIFYTYEGREDYWKEQITAKVSKLHSAHQGGGYFINGEWKPYSQYGGNYNGYGYQAKPVGIANQIGFQSPVKEVAQEQLPFRMGTSTSKVPTWKKLKKWRFSPKERGER